MDFPRISLREQDPHTYWSSLYKAVWARIKQELVVLDREFQYALESEGYPPIDVNRVVKRFGDQGTFKCIPRFIDKLDTEVSFWVVPGKYRMDETNHEQIILRKISLLIENSKIKNEVGRALVQMVHSAAGMLGLTYSTKLTDVKDWQGRTLSERDGAIDIVLISLKRRRTFGVEAKNRAPIIDKDYSQKHLEKHLRNCRKLGMRPVFVVSRIFPTVAEELRLAGAAVVETGVQFYPKKNWPVAQKLKKSLGYHFARKIGHHKSMARLATQLSSIQ